MSCRLRRRWVMSPARVSCCRWKVSDDGGRRRVWEIVPAGSPSGPRWTSRRNTDSRVSWASAPSASMTCFASTTTLQYSEDCRIYADGLPFGNDILGNMEMSGLESGTERRTVSATQSVLDCPDRGLRPVARMDLAKNVPHMNLYRRLAYLQVARDRFIRGADKKKLKDLPLLDGQAVGRITTDRLVGIRRRRGCRQGTGRKDLLSQCDEMEGMDQRRRRYVVEKIAVDVHRAELREQSDHRHIAEHNDFHPGVVDADAMKDLAVVAVGTAVKIDQHELRASIFGVHRAQDAVGFLQRPCLARRRKDRVSKEAL